MQLLRLAANPQAGLVHMLDRCRRHMIPHGLGEAVEPFGTVLADPRDGRGASLTPKRSAISSTRRFSGSNW